MWWMHVVKGLVSVNTYRNTWESTLARDLTRVKNVVKGSLRIWSYRYTREHILVRILVRDFLFTVNCSQGSSRSQQLQTHMHWAIIRLSFMNLKAWVKGFRRKCDLKKLMRKHTEDKSYHAYTCNEWVKTFYVFGS